MTWWCISHRTQLCSWSLVQPRNSFQGLIHRHNQQHLPAGRNIPGDIRRDNREQKWNQQSQNLLVLSRMPVYFHVCSNLQWAHAFIRANLHFLFLNTDCRTVIHTGGSSVSLVTDGAFCLIFNNAYDTVPWQKSNLKTVSSNHVYLH